MRLEETQTEKLYELLKLLEKHPGKLEDWTDDLRDDLVDVIVNDIMNEGYDGDNDYEAMYWFMKGKQLVQPQTPERYIDSDEYIFGTKFNKKREEQLKEDSYIMRLKIENERLNKKYNQVKEQNKELLKQLPNHQKSLKKFYKEHKPTDAETNAIIDEDYKLFNRERMRSYQEFLLFENQDKAKQDEIINKIIKHIRKNPTDWYIDFRLLNTYGKSKIVEPLIDVLENVVAKAIDADELFKFSYLINSNDKTNIDGSGWRSFPLNDQRWTQLIEGLRNGLLLDTVIDNGSTPIFSDSAYDVTLYWYYFDVVQLKQVKSPKKEYKKNSKGDKRSNINNKRKGKFFAYWNKTNLDLERYQVFSKDGDYLMNRNIEKVPCVIYSLSQLLPEGITNCMVLRLTREKPNNPEYLEWTSNCYNSEHLNILCKEFKIYCRLHYYDEYSIKPQFRIIERGVPKNESKYQIELAMYKEHYFIYEKTKYTRYFIQHYEELKDLKDPYKIVGKRKSGTYQRDSRSKYCLNSLDLLIEMMEQGLFEKMTFHDLYLLRKPLRNKNGKKITKDTPISEIEGLDFDDFGRVVSLDLAPPPEDRFSPEWYDTPEDIIERKIYNGYTLDEMWGCKDNNYCYRNFGGLDEF